MKKLFSLLISLPLLAYATAPVEPAFNPKAAWLELENVIRQQYAYADRPGLNFAQLLKEFEGRASNAASRQEFKDLSQNFLRHFRDPHLNLGPYDSEDYSVFPTGSDMRAVYSQGKFIIEDVKADGAADLAKIRPGAEIISIDGLSARAAVEQVMGSQFDQLTAEQITYAINISLGGKRNCERVLELSAASQTSQHRLPASYEAIQALEKGPTLSYKQINDIGYIRFNNSLGKAETVKEFDQAISVLLKTKALIIDLRNTPSGGNTGVAEPILGHFVKKKTAYQLYRVQEKGHSYRDARLQVATTSPRSPYYAKTVVVLAGRWTGSMGEGMTIAWDAIGVRKIIGAPMADLLGGIKTVQLTQSNSWLEFGFERMYHVNKSFREDFEPGLLTIPADRDADGNDPALIQALRFLSEDLQKPAK